MVPRKPEPVPRDPGQMLLIPDEELPHATETDLARLSRPKGPVHRHVYVLTYKAADGESQWAAFNKTKDALTAQTGLPPDSTQILAVRYYLTLAEWRAVGDR